MSRLIALCVALVLSALPAYARCTQPADTAQRMAQALAQINTYRAGAGLRALSRNDQLTNAALAHACDMARMRKMSHTGSNGSTLPRRVKAQGYRYRAINENVADITPNSAVAPLWYNSAGHRANMLDAAMTDIGLGVASGAGNRIYWVMVGGREK